MKKYSKKEIDLLLARGELSGSDNDKILKVVLNKACSEKEEKPNLLFRRLAFGSMGLVIVALAFWGVWRYQNSSGFRAKGFGSNALIEMGCTQGFDPLESRCSMNDTLLFRVGSLPREVYLVAYADGPDDTRVWYFPTDDGYIPHLNPSTEAQFTDRAVVIGTEHAPGHYQVHVLLFSSPVPREAVDSATPLEGQVFPMEVVP